MADVFLVGDNGALSALAMALGREQPGWTVRRIPVLESVADQLDLRAPDVMLAALGSEPDAYADLFADAAVRAPNTLRFVLLADDVALPPAVRHAHQVLALRTEPESLLPVIAAGVDVAARAATHPSLQQIVGGLCEVPSPPTLFFDIREQVEGRTGDARGVARAAERDPALVARILRIANSGFYGVPRTVSDLEEAVGLLGTDALLALVLAAHLYAGLPPPGLKLEALWHHAAEVSGLAREIASREGASRAEQSQCAVAGLLHDIGILVFLENDPVRYQPLWRRSAGDEMELAALERETFGVSHGELGAMILRLWNLPEPVVLAVEASHAPLGSSDAPLVTRAVTGAELLLSEQGGERVAAADADTTLGRWNDVCRELRATGTALQL